MSAVQLVPRCSEIRDGATTYFDLSSRICQSCRAAVDRRGEPRFPACPAPAAAAADMARFVQHEMGGK